MPRKTGANSREEYHWIQLAVQLINRMLCAMRPPHEIVDGWELASGLLLLYLKNGLYVIAIDPRQCDLSPIVLGMKKAEKIFLPQWESRHLGWLVTVMMDSEPRPEWFRDHFARGAVVPKAETTEIEWYETPYKMDVAAFIAADTHAPSAAPTGADAATQVANAALAADVQPVLTSQAETAQEGPGRTGNLPPLREVDQSEGTPAPPSIPDMSELDVPSTIPDIDVSGVPDDALGPSPESGPSTVLDEGSDPGN